MQAVCQVIDIAGLVRVQEAFLAYFLKGLYPDRIFCALFHHDYSAVECSAVSLMEKESGSEFLFSRHCHTVSSAVLLP